MPMSVSRKHLHEIIDRISEERLPSMNELLKRIYEEEEEELSPKELAELDEAKKRIQEGEYSTFEDVFGE